MPIGQETWQSVASGPFKNKLNSPTKKASSRHLKPREMLLEARLPGTNLDKQTTLSMRVAKIMSQQIVTDGLND